MPAVIGKSGISGCNGLSVAIFSIVLLRRGCSSVSKILVVPSRIVTSMATISSCRRPSSIAAIARSCERTAHASQSARVSPADCAVLYPTVMDMSKAGASGVAGCDGDIHCSYSSVPSLRFIVCGDVDNDSDPPAMTTLSMPAMMLAAAPCTAAMPDAQWPVEGDARDLDESELDRGVAGDVSPTLERLAEREVVDVAGRDVGALERLGDRVLGEVEGAHVDQACPCGRSRWRCGPRRR